MLEKVVKISHLSIDFFQGKYYNKIAMKPYEYIEQFKVKYCETDFRDQLKTSIVLSYMEEVACASADELGFGYDYLKPKGHAFMVSAISCEFLKPIKLGETVIAKTWPLPPSYVVFQREYQFLSQQGEPLVNASSRWCLIDMANGKLLQSKTIEGQDYSTYNTAKALDGVQWKIPAFDITEGELRFTMTVANSEYDHNMHVNNTRYADYCINCFSLDELSARALKRFQISYIKQCREGEVLRFYKKPLGDEVYLTQGVNEKDEIVVQAKLTFALLSEENP